MNNFLTLCSALTFTPSFFRLWGMVSHPCKGLKVYGTKQTSIQYRQVRDCCALAAVETNLVVVACNAGAPTLELLWV